MIRTIQQYFLKTRVEIDFKVRFSDDSDKKLKIKKSHPY